MKWNGLLGFICVKCVWVFHGLGDRQMFQKNCFHLLCLLRQNITLAFALNSEAQPEGSKEGFLQAKLIKGQLDVSEVHGHWSDTGEEWTFSAQTMILSATIIVTAVFSLLKFFNYQSRSTQTFSTVMVRSFFHS